MAILSFASCNNGGEDATQPATAPTEAPTSKPEVTEDKKLNIVEGGKAVDIVYSLDATADEKEIAQTLADNIEANTGAKPNLKDDYVKLGENRDSETVEILVGDTAYDETMAVKSFLNYGSAGVMCYGNKIVLAGYTQEAVQKACTEFNKYIRKAGDGSGVFSISAEYSEIYVVNESLAAVPCVDMEDPTQIRDMGNGGYMVYFKNKEKAFADSYIEMLQKKEFTLVQDNSRSSGNYFATYLKGDAMVSLFYTGNNKEFRIVVETNSNETVLMPTPEELGANNAKVCEPLFSQIGVYNSDIGECYLIRLADGSFIVIDGGYDYAGCVNNIYNAMVKQAPDANNIVISAWIITHAHGDHYKAMLGFSESVHATKVDVKYVIYNNPSETDANTREDPNDQLPDIIKAANRMGAKLIKAHAGNIFNFCGAEIEMIYTYDLLAGNYDRMAWYNNFSLAFNVSIEGVDFLMLGDIAHLGAPLMADVYGDYLKSDVVQVSHHGVNSVVSSVYKIINADYAVWPCTKDSDGKPVHMIASESGYVWNNAKKIWIADTGIQIFSFGKDGAPGRYSVDGGSFTVQVFNTMSSYISS